MPEQTVLDAVTLAVGALSGITVVRQEWPLPQPWTGGIGALIYTESQRPAPQRLTDGPDGIIEEYYTVAIRVILGPLSMTAADATAARTAARPWAERLRRLVYGDPTFGGVCFGTTRLGPGQDNLPTFARDQVQPALLWRLFVVEHIAASAAAA